jgi:hypothetical protein
MMKVARKRVLCALTVAGLGVLLLLPLLHRSEPLHNGKPLRYWLNQLLTANHAQAELVIQEFGTNIIPILRAKLKTENSPLRNWYRKTWPIIPAGLQRWLHAPMTLDEAQEPIHRALCALGSPAVPYLVNWLQSGDPILRLRAIYAIRDIGPAASTAVPILTNLINDADPTTSGEAAFALVCVGTPTNGAIPALVRIVNSDPIPLKRRGGAAWALGRMGAAAQSGVPALKNLSKSNDPYARVQAEIALWRIERDTNMLPRLVSELAQAPNVATCDRILVALDNSEQAISMVVEMVNRPNWSGRFGGPILEHLRRVHPKKLTGQGP